MSSVFLLSCCAAIALCQSTSYSALPSALPYTDGNFSSPYGPTHVFTEGAYLNISWESDYSSANLYLIRGQDFADPISIAINYARSWYNWQVDGHNNLTKPFLFRVVNALGTEEEQLDGGFDSEQFYIAAAQGASATKTSALSSTTLRSGHGATSAAAATSTRSGDGSSKDSSGGLSSGASIGIGAGIGVGAGLLLLAGAAFFFWRRHSKRKESEAGAPAHDAPPPWYNNSSEMSYGGSQYQGGDPKWQPSHSAWGSPDSRSPPVNSLTAYELPSREHYGKNYGDQSVPVEAPGHTPQEMPTQDTRYGAR